MTKKKNENGQNGIFLSMVIAAYQVEEYAQTCIDSILRAQLPNLELLVVLGNSADRTNEICRAYEQKGLLTCLTQEGKGLSNARNCGMRAANGAYLTFVDADDWLDTRRFAACMRYLQKVLQNNAYDVLINDFIFADNGQNVLFETKQIPAPGKRALGKAFTLRFVQSDGTFWNAWRYIYRTGYLRERGRKFWEGHNCEDLEFAVTTLLDTERTAFLHMPYYCYCPVRPQSLMNSKNLKMIRDFLAAERKLLRLCAQDDSPLADALAEKLKELVVLNLPDIWEADKAERRAAVRGYAALLKEAGLPEKRWAWFFACLCRSGGIVPASGFLYAAKRLRRMLRYTSAGTKKKRKADEEDTDADHKDAVSCQFLRRRKRYGGIL